jgi:hypothetical protein
MLGIGVERGIESAFRRAHLAHEPLHRVPHDALEEGLPGYEPRVGVERQQQCVVVEHLLEMRDAPVLVHAVAAEAASDLVVDAALGHLHQREAGDREAQLAAARGIGSGCIKRVPP